MRVRMCAHKTRARPRAGDERGSCRPGLRADRGARVHRVVTSFRDQQLKGRVVFSYTRDERVDCTRDIVS